MAYPSLLYLDGNQPTMPIPSEVITDLRIDLFLPVLTENISGFCRTDDILARREALQSVSEENKVRQALLCLLEICDGLQKLDDRYSAVKTEQEKSVVFLALCRELTQFAHGAGDFCGKGQLFEGFRSYFSDMTASSAFRAMENDLPSACRDFDSVSAFSAKYLPDGKNGEKAQLSLRTADTLTQRLLSCASVLGIEIQPPHKTIPADEALLRALCELQPQAWQAIGRFYLKYRNLYVSDILKYGNQIRFYLQAADMIDQIRQRGYPLSYPSVSSQKEIVLHGTYNIPLMYADVSAVIPNDIRYTDKEPFFFLTGANGGGKTTYLRTLGISVVLFLLGCPISCDGGSIGMIDSVFTHFPKDEGFIGNGRFTDEEARVETIFSRADGNSLILLNETFSTTNSRKAENATEDLAKRLSESGNFALYVTHQHQMTQAEYPCLSATVDTTDGNRRTFRIERSEGLGNSFARDILHRYGLTRDDLIARFGKEIP